MLTLERYPTADLLKLLANILTHIAQSNDQSNPVLSIAPSSSSSPTSLTSAAKTVLVPTTTTTTTTNIPLTFHARNVPTISLEAYLLRILKYCPTSNFVFLSLLVYFDRMAALSLASASAGRRSFHVDSYNVHRLVIAGVTVASKFFSDVFYTNSRYAKVGGLPLPELNQLELQFLLMNDFRLVISPHQMLLYSQHLITFSLDHPPPSMGRIEISVLAATLGINSPRPFPSPSPLSYPPPPPLVVLPPSTTISTASTPSSSSPHVPPSSPPLRPSTSPSPSPSNSSSSSLRSSPSPSPRPPRMVIITNGHHPNSHSRRVRRANHRDREQSDSDDDDDDDDDSSDSDKGDAEETETLTSTSTDDDSEPTIRGPRTIVGWDPDGGRKSP